MTNTIFKDYILNALKENNVCESSILRLRNIETTVENTIKITLYFLSYGSGSLEIIQQATVSNIKILTDMEDRDIEELNNYFNRREINIDKLLNSD